MSLEHAFDLAAPSVASGAPFTGRAVLSAGFGGRERRLLVEKRGPQAPKQGPQWKDVAARGVTGADLFQDGTEKWEITFDLFQDGTEKWEITFDLFRDHS